MTECPNCGQDPADDIPNHPPVLGATDGPAWTCLVDDGEDPEVVAP